MFIHEVGCTIPKRSKHKYQCSGNPDKPISSTSGEKTEAKILEVHVKSRLWLSPSVGVWIHTQEKRNVGTIGTWISNNLHLPQIILKEINSYPKEEKERLKKKKKRNPGKTDHMERQNTPPGFLFLLFFQLLTAPDHSKSKKQSHWLSKFVKLIALSALP